MRERERERAIERERGSESERESRVPEICEGVSGILEVLVICTTANTKYDEQA